MPAIQQQTDVPEEKAPAIVQHTSEPPFGTVDWLYYWGEHEGHLPSPIDVSITGSMIYTCPELKWYNFDIYPHKIKLTNTGYTVILGAKWMTERPYLEGGCFKDKHVLSQVHFHWGADMTEGSDHTVDKRRYPGEMQVTYFRAEYMTQEEALRHVDGVVVVCYMIKYGVNPDVRLERIIEGFSRCRAPKSTTRIGPYPMSQLMPLFSEDYFLYWGCLATAKGDEYKVRWLVPRITLFASLEQNMCTKLHQLLLASVQMRRKLRLYETQNGETPLKMHEFRKLWNPWDEPNLGNFRPLQERGQFRVPNDDLDLPDFTTYDRHIWCINPHWNLYNSTLPIPRIPEASISILSPEYRSKWWMFPPQNEYMIAEIIKEKENNEDNQT